MYIQSFAVLPPGSLTKIVSFVFQGACQQCASHHPCTTSTVTFMTKKTTKKVTFQNGLIATTPGHMSLQSLMVNRVKKSFT